MIDEFTDMDLYKKLIGKMVVAVSFTENADEGLVIRFSDGLVLQFGFSGGEGFFSVEEPSQRAKEES